MKSYVMAAMASLCATYAMAEDYEIGPLQIAHPMVFETAATARAGGGYMIITNTGVASDRLIDVRADYPRVQVHESVEHDGISRMQHLEHGLEIPAGGSVILEPGGYHIMFMGLDGDPFEMGEMIPATLTFEKAGEIDIMFRVVSRSGGMNGGTMNHGDTNTEEASE